MSQNYNSRRTDEDLSESESTGNLIKLLVVVKAPPHISQKYTETVCTAGVTGDGKWIRLYPINFRDLPRNVQFKKYQWIEVEAEQHNRDARPESFRPKIESIKTGAWLDTKNKWAKRKDILLPLQVNSLEEVYENYQNSAISLAIFKPKRIVDLIAVPANQRTPSQDSKQKQLVLIGSNPKPLDHIEYKFKYVFECDDEACTGQHTMTIEDWEIQELYRYAKLKLGQYAIDKILEYIKTKWLHEMWSETKDSYLIVGNVSHTVSFIVLGVFWPPK